VPRVDPWIAEQAARIAAHAERELDALVGVSSPSGDVEGAEELMRIVAAMLPLEAGVERVPCSSPKHAPDLLARVRGHGRGRILLLGHLDTVVAHAGHRRLERHGERLVGSGAVDMKGGVVLAIGVLRALASRPEGFDELALLLVVDEEWRIAPFVHAERFAGYDACLCFEAGELGPDGEEGVVVKRKAAGTLRIQARGRSAHSGSAPDDGRNALLALAATAQAVAAHHDPTGAARLSAVPTILNAGDAFNVVPGVGELYCDLRADGLDAIEAVCAALPNELDGVELDVKLARAWPGMDEREAAAGLLERASALVGRPVTGRERGGASDASHFAGVVPYTVDGLGPCGGQAHHPDEYVVAATLRTRAEVALALALAALDG
jgi:glutamate carboxypeptidase